MKIRSLAALLLAATISAGCAQTPTASGGPRLYILDCGDIKPMDPNLFGVKKEEMSGDGSFVTPCYLVVHARGTLIWDVGQIPDAQIPGDGTEVVVQEILKARLKLLPQLQALGYTPADITYLAMSHYHLDHTANANLFAGSTWIVQQAEYDAMFGAKEFAIRDASSYDKLRQSRRITLNNEDHDVFGDGTVMIKTAPGHTPGHQMLYLRLKKFGPLLLEGDLYHLPEERTLDRVPTFDFDGAMTRATRVRTEAFLRETGAQMWIQHDPPTNATLRKAPEYYD